jgi:hypothetical protein
MRPGVWWLLLGMLAGPVVMASGIASAGHLSRGGPTQAAEVEPLPGASAFDRDPPASEEAGDVATATRPGRETVADRAEEELGHVSRELDDLALTTLGRAEWLAGRLMRGTRTGAAEVQHAYLAVTTTLTSLGRCFEEGVASSPFGPAGPRAPEPPSGSAGADDPCELGQGNGGPGVIRHTAAPEQSDPDNGDAASPDTAIGGDTP